MNATAALALDSAITNRMKCDVHCLEGTRQGKNPIRLGARFWLMMRIVIVFICKRQRSLFRMQTRANIRLDGPTIQNMVGLMQPCSHAAKM